jgi:hypothetical protein
VIRGVKVAGIIAARHVLSRPALALCMALAGAPSMPGPGLSGTAAASDPAAPIESFEARVELAKAIEQRFTAYHSAMDRELGEQYAAAMRACFAGTPQPETEAFTLVGDLMPDGRLSEVALRPATNIGLCFAAALKKMQFPKPPMDLARSSFPITIRMNIAP